MAGEKILIVDDRRENILFLANDILRPRGYEIITAMNGEKGLKKALEEKPDLVITDMRMPKMNGDAVIQALREAGHNTPVILTTFHGSESTAIAAFRAGATDYLIKPFTVDEMVKAVERALASYPKPVTPPPSVAPEAETPALPSQELLDQQLAKLSTLHDIGRAITSLLALEDILSRTVEAAVYLVSAEESYLMLVDPSTSELYLRVAWGHGDKRARRLNLKVNDSLTRQVVSTGKPVILKPPPSGGAKHKLKTGYLMKSLLAIPLHREKEVIGVLSVGNIVNRVEFTEDDSQRLSTLGEYAAIAIDNARLYRQAQEKAEVASKEAPPPIEADIADCQAEAARLTDQLRALASEAEKLAQRLQAMTSSSDKFQDRKDE
jgi:two-component system NtrC family sensor kinase